MRLEAPCIRGVRLGSLVVVLLSFAVIGCGRQTGNVSGKVSYKGKPLWGGNVVFMSDAQGSSPKTSAINADGTYTVTKVPVGTAMILVLGSRFPRSVSSPPDQTKAKAEVHPDKTKEVYVPLKYANAERSGLKWDVKPGSQQYDIELE